MREGAPAPSRRARRAGEPFKPTREDLAAAAGGGLRDVIAPALDVLFCGINPGLYSAATGCHFARPGNRFWPALCAAGFTPRVLSPFSQDELLDYGCGVTNLVNRATRTAAELEDAELARGGRRLRGKLRRHRPRALAVLGVQAFRKAFAEPDAGVGRRPARVEGVEVWVLPNPSGANAHYSLDELARELRRLRTALRVAPAR